MPITRRQQASMSNYQTSEVEPSETDGLLPPTGNSEDGSPRLLTHDESLKLVPWQTDNDYILTGYRRQLHSIKACLWSSVAYFHNETINIHSHSLGAVFYLTLLPLHLLPTHFPHLPFLVPATTPIPPTWQDKVSLTVYISCAVTCLGLSSWFHTVQCHSKPVCDAAHRGDYIGIVVLIVGSILPGMYYGFHDNRFLMYFYMGAISTAGVASAYVVLSPKGRSNRWHRTLVFIGLGLSAVVPVLHITLTKGLVYSRQRLSLDLIVAGGASYIVGAVLYAARFPERLSPGTFDYVGASHQIFHGFVLLGAGLQYAAVRGMVWGRSMAVGKAMAGL